MPYEVDDQNGERWVYNTLEAARRAAADLPRYAIHVGYWKAGEPRGWSMGGATFARQSLIEAVR